jgi:quercetin dioxygenase-like cupin family protein
MDQRNPLIDWGGRTGPGPIDGVTAASAVGAQLSAALYVLGPGVVVPEHSHPNEEFGQVISGSLELLHAGTTHVLGAGRAFLVAGGVPHGARAGDEGCELLECYAPPRG